MEDRNIECIRGVAAAVDGVDDVSLLSLSSLLRLPFSVTAADDSFCFFEDDDGAILSILMSMD